MGGLQIGGTKSELAAQVEVQVNLCIVAVGRLQIVGSKSAVVSQVEVHVCIVVVGGLQIVVSKSAVAYQAEVQVHVGIAVDDFATCSRHEKRSRGAGRGTCACVHCCGWAGYR